MFPFHQYLNNPRFWLKKKYAKGLLLDLYCRTPKCVFYHKGGYIIHIGFRMVWLRSVLEADCSQAFTTNNNDMLSYSLTTMMRFLTKEWFGFPTHSVNLFIKANHKITYKEDLKVTLKRCDFEMICFSLWFWLWCAFYNRSLKKHIFLLSKCTSRLANKRIHIKPVSIVCGLPGLRYFDFIWSRINIW